MCKMDFSSAQERFWLDALPGATNNSHGLQQDLKSGSLGGRQVR